MTFIDYIGQPTSRTTLDAIEHIARSSNVETIDTSAAYITSGGLSDLTKRLRNSLGGNWNGVRKQWLTSFDYCRTEPIALEMLLAMPASSVRIYDAQFCLQHLGTPKIPFHPKALLFRNADRDYVLAGSGNISRSGLSRGVEAGLVIGTRRAGAPTEPAFAAVQGLRSWFRTTWRASTPLDDELLTRYSMLFETRANLANPVPTEDDIASSDSGRSPLSSEELRKLRVCRNLWIEAGNITKNRGKKLPGNQLMMKRLTRVFFGFSSAAVPENTAIGAVSIRFNDSSTGPYSLTYSDNGMDKLVLPIPGTDGPDEYDNLCLLFRKVTPTLFEMTLGSRTEATRWSKNSQAIMGAFKMTSGRQWGVF